MSEPILTMEERSAINGGRWFSNLSPSLRHDILRCAYVKRHQDGDLITARGDTSSSDGRSEEHTSELQSH